MHGDPEQNHRTNVASINHFVTLFSCFAFLVWPAVDNVGLCNDAEEISNQGDCWCSKIRSKHTNSSKECSF